MVLEFYKSHKKFHPVIRFFAHKNMREILPARHMIKEDVVEEQVEPFVDECILELSDHHSSEPKKPALPEIIKIT